MRVVYIANDGTQFDDGFDCEDYEWKLNHPRIVDIKFYDEFNNELFDPFSEKTYVETQTIIVPDDETAEQLRDLGYYTGFCCYEDITSAGKWVFNSDGFNGTYYKEEADD